MKLIAIATAALVACTSAVGVQKSVIVTYADNTPDSIVHQAMSAIKEAGGIVTHEYKLIKGFAAKAPERILETVQVWGNEFNALVEEDEVVTINTKGA